MFWTEVPRDVLQVTGVDAAKFLHSQLSQGVEGLAVGASAWSFLLQPTGKIDVLLRVWRTADETFVLDTDAGYGDAMQARLNRFKIRVKTDIAELDWRCIAVRAETMLDRDVTGGDGGATATPVPAAALVAWGGGYDLLGDGVQAPAGIAAGSAQQLLDARIAAVWPAMGVEIVPGATIPAETGVIPVAVSFTKGCYPGQELVERMDSRGAEAPRHLVVLPRSPGDAPGLPVVRDGHEVGTITSVGTTEVLALVRRGTPA